MLGLGLDLMSRAAQGQGVRAIDPATLYASGRKGAVWDYTVAGGAGLLSTTSLPTLTAPTSGQAIAVALGKRATDPLGIGPELAPSVTSDGWTLPAGTSLSAGLFTYSTATSTLVYYAQAAFRAAGVPYLVVGNVVSREAGDIAFRLYNSGSGDVSGLGYFTSVGVRSQIVVPTSSWNRAGHQSGGSGFSGTVQYSAREISARAARQGTSANREAWRSGALPSPQITVLRDQTIGTTWDQPGVDRSHVVVLEEPVTAAEIAGVTRWLAQQGDGYCDWTSGKSLPVTFPEAFTGAVIYRATAP